MKLLYEWIRHYVIYRECLSFSSFSIMSFRFTQIIVRTNTIAHSLLWWVELHSINTLQFNHLPNERYYDCLQSLSNTSILNYLHFMKLLMIYENLTLPLYFLFSFLFPVLTFVFFFLPFCALHEHFLEFYFICSIWMHLFV